MENPNDVLAEQLYKAVVALLKDRTPTGVLVAVADARTGITFANTGTKTKAVFGELAANLIKLQQTRI